MLKHKKFITFLMIILTVLIFCGCSDNTITEKYQLIRIHIRADSNEENAQSVKLTVRDEVRIFLEKKLEGVNDFETAYSVMEKNLSAVKTIADGVLKKEGFSYQSNVRLNNEYFPVRSYENVVVESGYYDALIIELGSGKGDNWWCVIYPPLCYLEAENSGEFKYKSYIAELIEKYFSKD